MAEAKQPPAAENGNTDFKSNIKGALSFSVPLILTSCLMYELGYYGHYNIYLGNYITTEDFIFFFFRDLRIITFFSICSVIAIVGLLFLKKLNEQGVDETLNGFLELMTGLFDSSWFSGIVVAAWIANKIFPDLFASLIKTALVAKIALWIFLPLYALLFIYTLMQIVTIENDLKKIRKMILSILVFMLIAPFAIGNIAANVSKPTKVNFTYEKGEPVGGPTDYLVGRTSKYFFLTNDNRGSKSTLQSVAYDAGDIGSILFTDSILTIVSKRQAPARPAVVIPSSLVYGVAHPADSSHTAGAEKIQIRPYDSLRMKGVIGRKVVR